MNSIKNLIIQVSSDDNISVTEDKMPRRDDQDPIPFVVFVGGVRIEIDYEHPGWEIKVKQMNCTECIHFNSNYECCKYFGLPSPSTNTCCSMWDQAKNRINYIKCNGNLGDLVQDNIDAMPRKP